MKIYYKRVSSLFEGVGVPKSFSRKIQISIHDDVDDDDEDDGDDDDDDDCGQHGGRLLRKLRLFSNLFSPPMDQTISRGHHHHHHPPHHHHHYPN